MLSTVNMKLISRIDVPAHLQIGSFYEMLDANDEGMFEVPTDCFKPDTEVSSHEDFKHVLASLSFWGVYKMPGEILRFVMKNVDIDQHDPLLTRFPEFEEYLTKILKLKASDPTFTTLVAIELGLGAEVVRFLREEMGFSFDPKVWEVATCMDDLASIIYLEEINVPKMTANIVEIAAAYNSMRIMEHAHAHAWDIPGNALWHAVRPGHRECVKFLHEVCGIVFPANIMVEAAYSGSLPLTRYLLEKECPWHEEVCAALARTGHLDGLMFAREMGCPWNDHTCIFAAESGHLQCLMFAHQQGCPWDAHTSHAAAEGGHLDCLQYAHQQGCPWNRMTMISAAKNGHFDCVTYACTHGCPVHRQLATYVLKYGEWQLLWFALQNGGVNRDVVVGSVQILPYAIMIYSKVYRIGRMEWPWGLILFAVFAHVSVAMEFFEPIFTRYLHMSATQQENAQNIVIAVSGFFFCMTGLEIVYSAVYGEIFW